MGQIWVVRAGKEGRLTDKFLQQGKIVIFFNDTTTDDLSGYDAQTLLAHLAGSSNRNASGQLVKFAYLMQVADTVLMPLKTNTDLIAVGEISSDYQHLSVSIDGGVHSRDVTWTGFMRRSSLSPAAIAQQPAAHRRPAPRRHAGRRVRRLEGAGPSGRQGQQGHRDPGPDGPPAQPGQQGSGRCW